MVNYQHTQRAYYIYGIVIVELVLTILMILFSSINWWVILLLTLTGVILYAMSSLTVKVDDKTITIYFGSKFFNKSFTLQGIKSSKVVSNPWYYGWGIHRTPRGWLYNVAGKYGIEVEYENGKMFRIGSDEPEKLIKAINDARKK